MVQGLPKYPRKELSPPSGRTYGRIETFIKRAVRDYVTALIKDKTLKFDDVPVTQAPATGAAPPTYDASKFVQTCPNAAGSLPLRQDILDLMHQKLLDESVKKAFAECVDKHNEKYNVSGVPYKGEGKRTSSDAQLAEEELKRSKVYEVSNNVMGAEFTNLDAGTFVGQTADHTCMVKARAGQETLWNKHQPAKLQEFLDHLESEGKTNIKMECHRLTETTKEVQGQRSTTLQIAVEEDCMFLAKPLPKNTKPSKGNAGSAMTLDEWDFPQGVHKLGRLCLKECMVYDSDLNSIILMKPAIFLTVPVKMAKGDIICLG